MKKNQRLYSFDIDVNLFYIPSTIKMEFKNKDGAWVEIDVDSKDFVNKKDRGDCRISEKSENPFDHFRRDDLFIMDFCEVMSNWPNTKGVSFDRFKESLLNGYNLSLITARGQSPQVIKTSLMNLLLYLRDNGEWSGKRNNIIDSVNNIDVYPVSSDEFNDHFGTDNYNYSVPYKKKLAFKDFHRKYYDGEFTTIGYSDDDPDNMSSIQEVIEDELIDKCENCKFVMYDTSNDVLKKRVLNEQDTPNFKS